MNRIIVGKRCGIIEIAGENEQNNRRKGRCGKIDIAGENE